MTRWISPGLRAFRDAVDDGLFESTKKEGQKRLNCSENKWHEQNVINPNGVEVKVLPYQEPLTKPQQDTLWGNAKAANWKYKHQTNTTGKAGESKRYNPSSTRALNDEEAIICRVECIRTSLRRLAIRFGVSENAVRRCVDGYTYKHLNSTQAPRK